MRAIGFGLGMGMGLYPQGLAPYLGNIATRAYLNRASGFNSGLTGMSSRMAHWLRDDVTSIRLGYANWYLDGQGGSEVAIGDTLRIRAALETEGGARTSVTFGGTAQGSVGAGGLLLSDEIALPGASGAKFYSRTQQLNDGGCCYVDNGNSAIGDRLDFDAGDHTGSGVIADGLPGYTYGPALILATTRKRTCLLLGTSRTYGVGDSADLSGDMGCIARSVGPSNGYCNGGSPSHEASDFAVAHAKTLALAEYFSDVFVEYGANDPPTSPADLQTIYDAFNNGQRLWGLTIDPNTSGAWTMADGSDQTAVGDYSTPNTFILSKPAPLHGVFDIAAPVSLAGNPRKWAAPGYTADGIHASQAANLARQAALSADIQAVLA